MAELPSNLWFPHPAFAESFDDTHAAGVEVLQDSSVAIVGLARNCEHPLAANLERVGTLGESCKSWQLHIESNDCEDGTLDVLTGFASKHSQATYCYQTLDRPHVPGEFAGRRTIALAEYRDACQRWVRDCAAHTDFVLVLDFDVWGGFSIHGLANAVGWMAQMPTAYGMCSVSIFQHNLGGGPEWLHYDLWALRGVGQRGNYWDQYRGQCGGWAYSWIPPVGSPPVLVSSAFGGAALYRTPAYLAGTYDGTVDCEHVAFHRSVAKATGHDLYVCPSMRTIVRWLEQSNAGHGSDSVQDISSHA